MLEGAWGPKDSFYAVLHAEPFEILSEARYIGDVEVVVVSCIRLLCNHRTEDQSIIVFVSPLVALMKDQVRLLSEKNMTATNVRDKQDVKVAKICGGNSQLIFLSPEALTPQRQILARHTQRHGLTRIERLVGVAIM